MATAFSATMADFIETHRGGKVMLCEGYKCYMIREGKKVKCLGDAYFHKAACKGREASIGNAVYATCTEQNHPPHHNWCPP